MSVQLTKKRPYTPLAKHRNSKCRRLLTHEIELNRRKLVLEIGSGQGRNALWFASSGVSIVALEINSKYCMMSKERSKKEKLGNCSPDIIRADAQNLPFQDAVFDVILCKAVLHHILNLRQLVTEMHKVVKKNGLVAAIDEPNALNPLWHIVRFLACRLHIRAYFLRSNEFLEKSGYEHFPMPFYRWQLEEYFWQGDFKIVKSESIWLPYVTYSKLFFKLWFLLERVVERTFIPYVFGQLFIVAKK